MNKTLEEKIKRNGVKIKKVEMAEIVMVEKGLREHLSNTNCVFAYSLLLRKLLENKSFASRISKNAYCRDIICVDYSFGLQTETQELERLKKNRDYKLNNGEDEEEVNLWYEASKKVVEDFYRTENLNDYNKENLRIKSYENGFKMNYKDEEIEYVMWFRTPAKARIGQIYYISKQFYDKIYAWQTMGINLPKENAKIVELGAYMSLTASHIEGTMKINPKNILVLKDFDSITNRNCAIVKTNSVNECVVEYKESEVKNTLWDGMAIIEDSKCPNFVNGGALLRQHMFKAFASRGYIQKFFRDYCKENGLDYNKFKVTDIWGNEHKVKDIEMITTENAVKFIKFDFSYNEWCKKVKADDNVFGICKTDHSSKLGNLQQASYQMVNSLITLDKEQVQALCEESLDYLNGLKDTDNLIKHLDSWANFSNCYEMVSELIKRNRDIADTKLVREYVRNHVVPDYKRRLKGSKLLFNADNLVLVGNPYGLLLHSVGAFTGEDKTLEVSDNYISCYTSRFKDGELLAGFRSPQNSPNNIGYMKNCYSEEMTKYFNFSDNILVLNGIGSDWQSRFNGADLDSDAMFVTNNNIIVECAKKCYKGYPTIVNAIEESKKTYDNTLENYAKIDHELAKAKKSIGEFSNIAQIALSLYYEDKDSKYKECFEISSVLAQVAIDNAKRVYNCNLLKELRSQREIVGNKFPKFFREFKKKLDDNERFIDDTIKDLNNCSEDKEAVLMANTALNEFYNTKDVLYINIKEKYTIEQLIQMFEDMRKVDNSINCVSNMVIDIIDNGYEPNTRRDKYKKANIIMNNGKANSRQLNRMEELTKEVYKNYVGLIGDDIEEEDIFAEILFDNELIFDEARKMKINDITYSRLLYNCFNYKSSNKMYMLKCLYNADKNRFLNFFAESENEKE